LPPFILLLSTHLLGAVTVLTGARIIDGTGGKPLENGALVIDADRIVKIGPMALVGGNQ